MKKKLRFSHGKPKRCFKFRMFVVSEDFWNAIIYWLPKKN